MEDELIVYGGELKALGEGRVGGVLVRRTNKSQPDLTGDYFGAESDIRSPEKLDVYYNHGMDSTLKKRVIGQATITRLENGDVWAETQLKMRDEYEKAIYAMAEAGKLGYSSGALSHLVEREPAGKGIWMIKTWVIGEASLTPTPAEYRNTVVTLKSLQTPDAALPDKEENKLDTKMENKKMDEPIDVKALVAEGIAAEMKARDEKAKAEADRQAEIKAASDAAYKQALEDVKSNKAPMYHSTEPVDDDNDGMGAFKSWMKTGQENGGLIRPDSSFEIKDAKAAWNVTTGGSGGFLVPDPLYQTIIAKRDLSSWVRQAPVQSFQTSSDHLLVPRESTKQAAWTLTAEAAAYTEDEGTVTQKDLILYKYTKLTKVSEEFLMYQSTNWESWFSNALGRSVATTENTMYTSGTGTGEPEGITAATASALTIATSAQLNPADLTALIGKLGAGYNVPSECGFVGANASKWYLKNAILSGPFAFTGANGGAPAPEFFGYPFYVSDDVQSYTATSGVVLYFGNLNYFGVVEKPGIIVQRNPYLYMANGQIGIFASIFRGGGLLQAEAIYSVNGK